MSTDTSDPQPYTPPPVPYTLHPQPWTLSPSTLPSPRLNTLHSRPSKSHNLHLETSAQHPELKHENFSQTLNRNHRWESMSLLGV